MTYDVWGAMYRVREELHEKTKKTQNYIVTNGMKIVSPMICLISVMKSLSLSNQCQVLLLPSL